MEFKIISTDIWNNPQRLIEEYPCLKDYSLEVKRTGFPAKSRIHDENGRPVYQTFTQFVYTPYITINTIDDLMNLVKSVENPLIINTSGEIEIYDGYRE